MFLTFINEHYLRGTAPTETNVNYDSPKITYYGSCDHADRTERKKLSLLTRIEPALFI